MTDNSVTRQQPPGSIDRTAPRQERLARADLVGVAPSDKRHMPLVKAMRKWRKVGTGFPIPSLLSQITCSSAQNAACKHTVLVNAACMRRMRCATDHARQGWLHACRACAEWWRLQQNRRRPLSVKESLPMRPGSPIRTMTRCAPARRPLTLAQLWCRFWPTRSDHFLTPGGFKSLELGWHCSDEGVLQAACGGTGFLVYFSGTTRCRHSVSGACHTALSVGRAAHPLPKCGIMQSSGSGFVFTTKVLACQELGDTYKWMLFGDDDTLFFVDAVLDLLQPFDPDLPYAISENIWFEANSAQVRLDPQPLVDCLCFYMAVSFLQWPAGTVS